MKNRLNCLISIAAAACIFVSCDESSSKKSNTSDACSASQNTCLDAHTASICGTSGIMEKVDCKGDTPDCKGGKCVAAGAAGCTEADNKCLDGHTASICGTSGEMETVECKGETPDCKGGKCVAAGSAGCTAADNKCLDGHTASICGTSGEMETVECKDDTPDCKGGKCVAAGTEDPQPSCTPQNDQCTSLTTALVCNEQTHTFETIECSGETPNCRNGKCIKGECENNAIRCLNESLPQKCVNNAWETQSACSGSTPVCANGKGCIAECSGDAVECDDSGKNRKFCESGTWQYEACPSAAPVCVKGECKISEVFWCVFHWLEYDATSKTAQGYGRIWIPDEINADELSGYMACTNDLSKPVLEWDKIDATVNPKCYDCGANNTEYMTSAYQSVNGYNYCTFIYAYRDEVLACRPQQNGEAAPIRVNAGDKLDALYTRYFYQIGDCSEEGKYTCANNKRMQCVSGNWVEDKVCSGSTPRCDHATNDCVPECSEGDRYCGSGNTATQCRNGVFTETKCDNYCYKGECVDCVNGDKKCNGNVPQECINGHWESQTACAAPKGICITTGDERCISECNEGEAVCDPGTNTLKYCNNGRWEYQSCAGNKPFCQAGDNKCSGQCTEDDAICSETDFSLKVCKDGVWQLEKCPDEKPYCKTGAEGCIELKDGDSCNPETFVPFIRNDTLYLCVIDSRSKAKIYTRACDGECMTAKHGYGVIAKEESCSNKGSTKLNQLRLSYNWDWDHCVECKPNQDGALIWLAIPANYKYDSYTGYPNSCTPWPE